MNNADSHVANTNENVDVENSIQHNLFKTEKIDVVSSDNFCSVKELEKKNIIQYLYK